MQTLCAVEQGEIPTWYRGRHVEFNKSAADQSQQALREFFHATVEGK